jgi:hypothetical protein
VSDFTHAKPQLAHNTVVAKVGALVERLERWEGIVAMADDALAHISARFEKLDTAVGRVARLVEIG